MLQGENASDFPLFNTSLILQLREWLAVSYANLRTANQKHNTMAIDQEYLDYIVGQLSEFGDFEHKKMFGGIGFFRGKIFFAGILAGVFRLKADETNIPDFEKYDKGPWRIENRNMTMSYYEVPEEIVSDKFKLAEWAGKAFDVALRSKK